MKRLGPFGSRVLHYKQGADVLLYAPPHKTKRPRCYEGNPESEGRKRRAVLYLVLKTTAGQSPNNLRQSKDLIATKKISLSRP